MDEPLPIGLKNTPQIFTADRKPVSENTGSEKEALRTARLAFRLVKDCQDENNPFMNHRRDVVLGKCIDYSEKLAAEMAQRGFDVAPVTEENTFNLAYGGKRFPHTLCIARLGEKNYMLIDPTVAQYIGEDSDEVALFVTGSLEDIRGYAQRRYSGAWKAIDESHIGHRISGIKTMLRYQKAASISEGQEPAVEPLTSPHIEAATEPPLPDEVVWADIEAKSIRLLRDGGDPYDLSASIHNYLLQRGLIRFKAIFGTDGNQVKSTYELVTGS